jgi:hypothetical protein
VPDARHPLFAEPADMEGPDLAGADAGTRNAINAWLLVHAGRNVDFAGVRNVFRFLPVLRIPTVTPADVRERVKAVWSDS